MKKREVALKLFRHLLEHSWHGYSQISRWGDGAGTCPVVINGKTYQLQQGDRDCSSAIISAFEAAGISCGGATFTGNMRDCMVATGNFRWHPGTAYIAKPGDVYLNEACHTAMCMSAVPDRLGEFSISETGGIDGAEGDQTGWESHECDYYNYPWDGILECINDEEDKADSQTPKTGKIEMRQQKGTDNQRFQIEDAGGSFVRIKSKSTGLYLDVPGANAVNGAVLQLYPKNGTDAQLWKIVYKAKGLAQYVQLEPKLSPGRLASVESNGVAGDTAKLKLWNDQNSSKQTFWLKQADDGTYVFVHTYSLKAITAV